MATTHIVVRPLPVNGETLPIGTEVDASGWRTLERLVRQRYLKPVEGEKSAPPLEALDEGGSVLSPRVRGRKVRDAN